MAAYSPAGLSIIEVKGCWIQDCADDFVGNIEMKIVHATLSFTI
ncbi:hypothetical protein F441_20124 [Phytophthora nicotianae CJ01A1]|uniref:Uncharacterized protein n=6 Tax=Phytophthora nicotianae TaxID=4792 RepID=W2PI63_PHYN3|nr:hypothetical protein PPTG_24280 [Phytophthora nicotianae INRA-310]ETI33040.1 hypothetical protein F443_20233 [Phytophthora nicotianae P1569]ETK73374.1 hypothetical protein L915_19679 [Phytophthora nicotianae]ETO61783.1 hypothetical protein F444_20249 [Phytophthora nicotianae P1976]ETP02848.1 hypothetical protein F441_20124 [Phytophthora nicotianae CJ01A1]ETP31034.1 hypothetical protein F442_20056 [Phytophthora nicotianae P10297]